MADQTTNIPNFDELFDDEIVIKDASGQTKTVKSSQLSDIVAQELDKKKQVQGVMDSKMDELIREAIESVVKQAAIDFRNDEILEVRFKNIILARLKGIRDKSATKLALTKPRVQGGLTLVEDIAQNVLEYIEQEAQKIRTYEEGLKPSDIKKPDIQNAPIKKQASITSSDKHKQQVASLKKELTKPVDVSVMERPNTQVLDVREQAKKADYTEDMNMGQSNSSKMQIQESQSSESGIGEQEKIQEEKVIEPLAEQTQTKEGQSQSEQQISTVKPVPKISRPQIIDTGRPRMEDVRAPHRLVGPVDELRKISIEDFRRMSEKPSLAAQKIGQQLSLLEDDSFGKRMEGILAYFQSPLFAQYIQLGLDSLEQKTPLKDIMQQKGEEDSLTMQEFLALNEFHQSLF